MRAERLGLLEWHSARAHKLGAATTEAPTVAQLASLANSTSSGHSIEALPASALATATTT